MINVYYNQKFIKDLKKLKGTQAYEKIKVFCFDELPSYKNISELVQIKKIESFSNYYRIRIGDYRIGVVINGDDITVMRALHRKDIYNYFP